MASFGAQFHLLSLDLVRIRTLVLSLVNGKMMGQRDLEAENMEIIFVCMLSYIKPVS